MRPHSMGSVSHWPAGPFKSARPAIATALNRYSPVLSDENEEIADWLKRLIAIKRSWGFGLCFLYLRNVQDYLIQTIGRVQG